MKYSRNIHSLINNSAFGELPSSKKRSFKHNNKRGNNSRINKLLLLAIIFICGTTMFVVKGNALHNTEIQKGIAKEIIRFHVIANSDSDSDQALKLKVKDKLVERLAPLLNKASSINEARSIITDNEDLIQKIAKETINKNGYNYPVSVSLENCYFPLKLYGEYSFPPGYYEALRVRIGEAKGKNWWCVMFPPLCFVDDTYSVVDSKTDQKLKHLLTKEEYDSLIENKVPVKIKFKLWDSFKELFQ